MVQLNDNHIIVFTRYPKPGRTKTRLIPALGEIGAAELHRWIVEQTMHTVRQYAKTCNASVEVCYTGGDEKKIKAWLGAGVIFTSQTSGDIGRRMKFAFDHAFANGAKQVLLMGTDIPHISVAALKAAFSGLLHHDVVIGPSTDGGYWLMGLSRSRDLFADIAWSTADVLPQTMDQCQQKELRVHLLDPLTDVDTVEDLTAALPEKAVYKPYVSVIIPALNEEDRIASAIISAQHASAEIIVVDGGSQDKTIKTAAALGAKVLTSPKGRAVQQNCGAKQANGDILLFLHADTLLPDAYVETIFEALLDKKTVMGAFQFKTSKNTPLMGWFETITNIRSKLFQRPYGDQGLFLRKETFDCVGGFPQTPLAEDLMLVRQLAKSGNITTVNAEVITSARRWETIGAWKTFFINQIVVMGFALGVSPDTLAGLYQKADPNLYRKRYRSII